ncbi:MAG: hypothetical protein GTO62_14730 [Planctomycetales bacterium]|nr:hypothetical protein [Planctomycetales bacterium]NIN76538.1 hypothetical protein [Planctomycetales bacterium]NIP68123.1 hypothetical protein [Planctomycetales bacterium]
MVVKLDGNGLEPLLQMTRKLGFALDRNEAEQTFRLGDHLVVTSPSHPFRMGLWWVRTAYDQVALARRRKARVQGETAWFCSPEDTVLSLLGAGRDRDVDAAGGIMGVQKGRLDWGYLRHWARPLSVDDRLERLRRELFI